MTGNRSKGAWIWVAMAAISFASLARVQSGVENARAYADPVIKFLPRPTSRFGSDGHGASGQLAVAGR